MSEANIPVLLQAAVIDAFKIQAGLAVTVLSVTADNTESQPGDPIDCMAVLGMKSSVYQGSLALGFPKATFLALLEKMLGEKYPDIDDKNADACGEMLNIIYASARTNINKAGEDFQPAIPTTVRGNNLSVALGASSRFLKFRCASDVGGFLVALKLKKS
jgi:CheY-specific phosphatase CheX